MTLTSDDFSAASDMYGAVWSSVDGGTVTFIALHTKVPDVPSSSYVHGYKVLDGLSSRVPDLYAKVPCPVKICDAPHEGVGSSLATVIQHLNDRWRWTREEIADWLDTLDLDLAFRPEPIQQELPLRRVAYASLDSMTTHAIWGEFQAAIWLDEAAEFALDVMSETTEWEHGSFDSVCPQAPSVPSYDPLRADVTDVPPDHFTHLGVKRAKPSRDFTKFSQGTADFPQVVITKEKRRGRNRN